MKIIIFISCCQKYVLLRCGANCVKIHWKIYFSHDIITKHFLKSLIHYISKFGWCLIDEISLLFWMEWNFVNFLMKNVRHIFWSNPHESRMTVITSNHCQWLKVVFGISQQYTKCAIKTIIDLQHRLNFKAWSKGNFSYILKWLDF